MSVSSLSRLSRNGRRTLLMTHTTAKHYYHEYCSKFSYVEIQKRFKAGKTIESPHNDSIHIWGENISDTECFRRRLKGTLSNEILGV